MTTPLEQLDTMIGEVEKLKKRGKRRTPLRLTATILWYLRVQLQQQLQQKGKK